MGWDRDWVFVAYVVAASAVLATTGVGRVRVARAFASFDSCAAHGDAECAADSLAVAQDLAPKEMRTRVAKADLHALLGETDLAERELVMAVGKTSEDEMDRTLRAEVVLAKSDIAVLRGHVDQARARWIEAAPLVDDPGLVEARRERQDAVRDVAMAALTGELGALHAKFEKLFEAAHNGDVQQTDMLKGPIDAQIATLPPDQRSRFFAASSAIRSAATSVAANRSAADSRPLGSSPYQPQPPKEPTPEEERRFPWLRQSYEARRQAYERTLKANEDRSFEALRADTTRIQATTDAEERAMNNAQRLMDEAFTYAATRSAP